MLQTFLNLNPDNPWGLEQLGEANKKISN
jgi:hypothetical protein